MENFIEVLWQLIHTDPKLGFSQKVIEAIVAYQEESHQLRLKHSPEQGGQLPKLPENTMRRLLKKHGLEGLFPE